MTKLTEQQKAENKAARGVRHRAYTVRKSAYTKALKDALDEVSSLEMTTARQAWRAAEESLATLHEEKSRKLAAIESAYAGRIEAARRSAKETQEGFIKTRREHNDRKQSVREAVLNAFPDLNGRAMFSSACWKPPSSVLLDMDAAREQVRRDAACVPDVQATNT